MQNARVPAIGGAAALLAILLLSFAWPTEPVEIAGSFGSDGRGTWLPGLLFASPEGAYALASEAGEVLYWHEETLDPEQLPSGLGSFIALDQGQDITAVYARLRPGSLVADPPLKAKGDILGVAGRSGYSTRDNILFALYDRINAHYVNPLILLPGRDDARPPVARAVVLRDAKGATYDLAGEPALKQGRYELIAEIADQGEAGWSLGPVAPFAVTVAVNGSERIRADFDLAEEKGGKRVFFAPADREYGSWYLGGGRVLLGSLELVRGRNQLDIIVADAGTSPNRKTVRYAFQVF